MKCSEAIEFIHLSLDGRLSGEAGKRLADHLSACPGCRQEQARAQGIRALIGTKIAHARAKGLVPSPVFKARFWAQVRERERASFPWARWFGVLRPARAVAAAGLMAVSFFLGMWFHQRRTALPAASLSAPNGNTEVLRAQEKAQELANLL